MNKSLKVLFFLRTRKSYVSGPAPIYMRVTDEGDRFEMGNTCGKKFSKKKAASALGTHKNKNGYRCGVGAESIGNKILMMSNNVVKKNETTNQIISR